MTTLQILIDARAKIANAGAWCKGALARDANGNETSPTDDDAVQFCALGAPDNVTLTDWFKLSDPERIELADALTGAQNALSGAAHDKYGWRSVVSVNDDLGHGATLAMYDAAIERYEHGRINQRAFLA